MSSETGHLTHEDAVKKVNELIKGIKFAMLTTVDTDGTLRSRPMTTQNTPFDGQLWFFSPLDSAKTHEIDKEHEVNLSYADPDKNRYVSVSGRAQVVKDRAKAEELWNPAYKAWFPQGLDDPTLSLLRVEVSKAEFWDSSSSPIVHAIGFAKAVLTGQRYQGGEHEKVAL